jgi:hypothetical protein
MANYEALIESRKISKTNDQGKPLEITVTRSLLSSTDGAKPSIDKAIGERHKREIMVTVTTDTLMTYGAGENPTRTLGISTKRQEGRADLSPTDTLVIYKTGRDIVGHEILDLGANPVKVKQARALRTTQPKNKSKKRPSGDGIVKDSIYPY